MKKPERDRSSNHLHIQADRDRQKPTRRRERSQEIPREDTPYHRRRAPYKREHVDYDYYLQEESLEDDWFEEDN